MNPQKEIKRPESCFTIECAFEMLEKYSQVTPESLGLLSAHLSCNEGGAYQSALELP